ncbi:unnamed protein product, partial [Durusdinium trenchii]
MLILVIDLASLASSSLLQAPGCCDAFLSVLGVVRAGVPSAILDIVHSGVLLLVQSSSQPGPFLLVIGIASADPWMLASDFLHLESLLLLRSFARSESLAPTIGLAYAEAFLSLHASCRLGFSLLSMGISCAELSLFVSTFAALGASLLLQSLAWFGFLVPTLATASMGSFLTTLQAACAEAVPPLQSFGHFELSFLALGVSTLDVEPSVLDIASIGVSAFARSTWRLDSPPSISGRSCPASSLLLLDRSELESSLSLRRSLQTDAVPPLFGLGASCAMLCPVFVLLLSLSFGAGCLGSTSPALDFLLPDFLLLLREFAQSGLLLFAPGLAWMDAPISMLGPSHVGTALLPQRFACLELVPPALSPLRAGTSIFASDGISPGAALLLHSFLCTGVAPLVLGTLRFDFLLATLGAWHVGSSSPARSLGRPGPAFLPSGSCRPDHPLPALDFVCFGLSLLARSFAHSDPGLLMAGDATFGGNVNLVSSLPARHVAHFGFFLLLLQISRLGSLLLVLDSLHTGSSLASRSFARCGSPVSPLNLCSVDSLLVMKSSMHPEVSMPSLGKACSGSILAVGGNLHPGAAIYFNGPGTYLQYDAGAT